MQIADVPNVLVVPAAAKTPNLKELIEKGKTKKGGLSYSSTGVGTSSHLASFMFMQRGEGGQPSTSLTRVRMRSNDLLAGRIDFMFATIPSVMPHIQSGKLVPIAVSSAQALTIAARHARP